MNQSPCNHQAVYVVTIRDKSPQGFLSFDTKDILLSLDPSIQSFSWLILEDDLWLTPEDLPVPTGQMLTSQQLRSLFEAVHQTIGGIVVGGPAPQFGVTRPCSGDLREFIDSPAQVMIRAVDSSFFEVMTKNPVHVQALRRTFQAVHEEDPSKYLSPQAKVS